MLNLIGGYAMRNVRVASLLQRSLTVAPRIFVGVLPLLALLYAPLVALAWHVDPLSLAGPSTSTSSFDFGGTRSERAAEDAAVYLEGALALWSVLFAPLVSAAVARAAIRASFGERLGLGFIAREAFRAIGRSLPVCLAAGVATLVGYAACWLPGVAVGAILFPVGAIAAIEERPFGKVFARSFALAKPQFFILAGVGLAMGVLETLVLRFACIIAPRSLYGEDDVSRLHVFGVVALVICAAFMTWAATAMALAYGLLRVNAESLEVDAVARELGGGARIDVPYEDVEAVSEAGMAARQRRRKWIGIAILAMPIMAFAIFVGIYLYDAKRQKDAQEARSAERERMWQSEMNAPRSVEPAARATQTPRASDETDPPLMSSAEIRAADDSLARRLAGSSGSDRRSLLGREVSKRVYSLYGPSLGAALSQLAKVSDDKLELAILPGLGGEVGASDCGKALQAARDAPPAKAASVFATNCPPPGVRRAIDPAKLASVPLWAGAIAVLLELHDRSAKTDDAPLSAAIRDALLSERAQSGTGANQ